MTKKPAKRKTCAMKRHKIKGCEGEYVQWSSFQKTCNNPDCALAKAIKDREKKEKQERTKTARERKTWRLANRTIAGWCLDARKQGFQPYVRLRDKGNPCISCGKENYRMEAGHYLTVGSRPELQFHPDNCHSQCHGCNHSKKSISHNYRANLIEKIGIERVEYLENYHTTDKLTIDEIKEIKAHYRAELKRLKEEEE
jgi:hypothetical protein